MHRSAHLRKTSAALRSSLTPTRTGGGPGTIERVRHSDPCCIQRSPRGLSSGAARAHTRTRSSGWLGIPRSAVHSRPATRAQHVRQVDRHEKVIRYRRCRQPEHTACPAAAEGHQARRSTNISDFDHGLQDRRSSYTRKKSTQRPPAEVEHEGFIVAILIEHQVFRREIWCVKALRP